MAHFAQIDSDNKVVKVLVIPDEQSADGQNYLAITLGLGGTWVQTSYDTNGGINSTDGVPLRKNYAGIGYTYDATRDAFIPPQPYTSWVFNESSYQWSPPVAYPAVTSSHSSAECTKYKWNEVNKAWEVSVVS